MAGTASYEDDKYVLLQFAKMIDELNKTQGTLAKIDLMKGYSHLTPLIRRVFGSGRTFITLAGIRKYCKEKAGSGTAQRGMPLYELFDALTERKLTGDAAKETICTMAERYPDHKDLIYGIMCKDVPIRMGEKTIMKAFPGMFQQFAVMLASDNIRLQTTLDENKHKIPMAYISNKKDGVRALVIFKDGKAKAYSRIGAEFTSLGKLQRAFESVEIKDNWVFDGEIEARDADGKQLGFKETVSQVKSKGVEMVNPLYSIFGMIPYQTWSEAKVADDDFSVELTRMRLLPPISHVEILNQIEYSPEGLVEEEKKARNAKLEGLMVRINAPWRPGRVKYLIKIKFMSTEEFTICKVNIEPMHFANSRGGTDMIPAVKNVMIEYKGDPVWVGSGFTAEERKYYATHSTDLIGKTITVQYQEPFQDSVTGKWSLRCPTLVTVLENGRDF
jgi:DNA ligase 1